MDRRSILFPLFFTPLLLSGQQPSASIAGRWRSVETTKGGIGAVYELHAAGSAAYSSSVIVETNYQQPGSDSLVVDGQSVGMRFPSDAALQLNYGANHVEDYVRQGQADAASPLLGEWRGTRVMNGAKIPVILTFLPSNRMLLVMYLRTLKGRYTGSTLTLPGMPARRLKPEGDRLQITVAGGDPHLFTRF